MAGFNAGALQGAAPTDDSRNGISISFKMTQLR